MNEPTGHSYALFFYIQLTNIKIEVQWKKWYILNHNVLGRDDVFLSSATKFLTVTGGRQWLSVSFNVSISDKNNGILICSVYDQCQKKYLNVISDLHSLFPCLLAIVLVIKLKCWENIMDSLQEICMACGEKCRPSGDSKIYYLNLFCQGIRNEGFRWLNLRFIFYLGFMWCYLCKLYKELTPQFCMVLRIPHISELL